MILAPYQTYGKQCIGGKCDPSKALVCSTTGRSKTCRCPSTGWFWFNNSKCRMSTSIIRRRTSSWFLFVFKVNVHHIGRSVQVEQIVISFRTFVWISLMLIYGVRRDKVGWWKSPTMISFVQYNQVKTRVWFGRIPIGLVYEKLDRIKVRSLSVCPKEFHSLTIWRYLSLDYLAINIFQMELFLFRSTCSFL